MAVGENVPYNPTAGITPAEGVLGARFNAQASPQDFGAQVGQSVEKAGSAIEEQATKWNGLISETAANQAELSYIKASGDLRAHYDQFEGLQAEAMRPKYEADLQQLHDNMRSNLPAMSQRMFDSATIRSLGAQTSDYANYAAGQVKKSNLDSHQAIAGQAVSSAGNLSSVLDDNQVGSALGTIAHSANAVADVNGMGYLANGKDEQGNYTFPDTDEGKQASARYQQFMDSEKSKYFLTGAKTVADNQGATAAATWVQKHWDLMPDKAKVELNQYLAPKMVGETIGGAMANQTSRINDGYNKQLLANVPASADDVGKEPAPDLLGIIHKNEGFTGKIGTDSNGANVVNGVNEKAFPDDYAAIEKAYGTSKEAGDAATNNFFQKNIIDKYDIKSLPVSTQAIVADGLVNHGAGEFGQSLIAAAKNGASPQGLIDMRRTEYQRLADADTDGSKGYAANLKGWNSRLDGLQPVLSVTAQNKADYLRQNADDYVKGVTDSVSEKYPGDYDKLRVANARARNEINHQISIEDGKLKSDRDTIDNAISGSLTKGVPPSTHDALVAIPGMQSVLDRTIREQGQYYGSIDTKIAKMSHGDASQNSPNAYDTILSTLDTSGGHDRQSRIEYLSKGLGTDNPGFSISAKDFKDAKPAIDLEDGQDYLSGQMKKIAAANGNIDGKGQDRAVQWYNQTMASWKNNQSMGDKAVPATTFFADGNKAIPAPIMPSRQQQINAVAKPLAQGRQATADQPPVITTKDQRDKLPPNTIYIRDGQQYRTSNASQ